VRNNITRSATAREGNRKQGREANRECL
jgi:hypothetical protein